MKYKRDIRIWRFSPRILKKKTILFVDGHCSYASYYVDREWRELRDRFRREGYRFLYLPAMEYRLDFGFLDYYFPGRPSTIPFEGFTERLREVPGLKGRTGFLYKRGRQTWFHELPGGGYDDFEENVADFLLKLNELNPPKRRRAMFGGPIVLASKVLRKIGEDIVGSLYDDIDRTSLEVEPIHAHQFDDRERRALEEWDRFAAEFDITLEELEVLLSFRVKLSPMRITTSGRILLVDWDKEVRLDDLTKAVYLFFLRHPEGVVQKDMLEDHMKEVLDIYLGITGRDDPRQCEASVWKLLDPYGNNLNVSLSRIKGTFEKLVGKRIAKFYYVSGKAGEIRKVTLDRDLVIWEH